jgi:hypothetical protein
VTSQCLCCKWLSISPHIRTSTSFPAAMSLSESPALTSTVEATQATDDTGGRSEEQTGAWVGISAHYTLRFGSALYGHLNLTALQSEPAFGDHLGIPPRAWGMAVQESLERPYRGPYRRQYLTSELTCHLLQPPPYPSFRWVGRAAWQLPRLRHTGGRSLTIKG